MREKGQSSPRLDRALDRATTSVRIASADAAGSTGLQKSTRAGSPTDRDPASGESVAAPGQATVAVETAGRLLRRDRQVGCKHPARPQHAAACAKQQQGHAMPGRWDRVEAPVRRQRAAPLLSMQGGTRTRKARRGRRHAHGRFSRDSRRVRDPMRLQRLRPTSRMRARWCARGPDWRVDPRLVIQRDSFIHNHPKRRPRVGGHIYSEAGSRGYAAAQRGSRRCSLRPARSPGEYTICRQSLMSKGVRSTC